MVTARETYRARIVCSNPRCGATGEGHWEENENPIRGLDRELLSASKGFSPKKGDTRADPDILCYKCGAIAHHGSN